MSAASSTTTTSPNVQLGDSPQPQHASDDLAASLAVVDLPVVAPAPLAMHDLSSVTPLILIEQLPNVDWARDPDDAFVKNLLALSAFNSTVVMTYHFEHDAAAFEARLGGLASAPLKKLAAHIGVTAPPKSSAAVTRGLVGKFIQAHAEKHPHLARSVEAVQRRSGTIATRSEDERKESRATEDEDEDEQDNEDEPATPPPRARSAAAAPAPRSSPRAKQKVNLLFDSAPSQSKPSAARALYQSAIKKASGLADNVLAAVAQLPSERSSVYNDGRSSGKNQKGKSKGKSGRRSPSASSASDSSSTDSDSDGPSSRRHSKARKKKSKGRRRSPSTGSSGSATDSSVERNSSRPPKNFSSSRLMSRREVDDELEEQGLARPMAGGFLDNIYVSTGRTTHRILPTFKEVEWKNIRNEREALTLARVIDILRRDHDVDEAIEVLCRRLAGVQSADQSGDWRLADALELKMEKQSFVPEHFLARAIKSKRRAEELEGHSSYSSARDRERKSKGHPGRSGATNRDRDRSTSREPGAKSNSRKSGAKDKKPPGPRGKK